MTWLSRLRSKLFANKLTSHISKYNANLTEIDRFISQTKLLHDTMISQQGDSIDHHRSAMKGTVVYRQGVIAPTTLILILDISPNRKYSSSLSGINQLIVYIIHSCSQLGVECTIIYPQGNGVGEYQHITTTQTIDILNSFITNSTSYHTLNQLLQEFYYNYDKHQSIIISDRLTYDNNQDNNHIQTLLHMDQVLGYMVNYHSPIIMIPNIPKGLITIN